MALVYFGYFWVIFGRPDPFALYGSRVPKPIARMTPGRTLLGVFLDGGFGLLVYAPVFVLGLAGLRRLLSRSRRERWAWCLTAGAVLLPVLAWKNWWGFSPPGRFLIPLVPMLAVAAAVRVAIRPTHGLARWRWPLVAAGLSFALLMSVEPRDMRMVHTRDGPLRAHDLLAGEVSPSRYLPRLTSRMGTERPPWRPPAAEVRVALVWAVALLLLLALDRRARSRRTWDQAFRGLALPVGLLLLVTLAVDYWARAPGAGTGPDHAGVQTSSRD
jgi:peptidoglycan/LPS O-acetylase OafA/YrhL